MPQRVLALCYSHGGLHGHEVGEQLLAGLNFLVRQVEQALGLRGGRVGCSHIAPFVMLRLTCRT